MGDIADAIINGDDCESCGEYLGDGPGYPRKCRECRREEARATVPSAEKVACPTCGKRVKAVGLKDHERHAHGVMHG